MTTNTNEDTVKSLKLEIRNLKLELINLKTENELLKKLILNKSPNLITTMPEYTETIDPELLTYLKRGPKRVEILKTLTTGAKIPSIIAKQQNDKVGKISHYLKDLKEKELIQCLNEEDKRHRFYAITPKGKKYLELLGTN